MGESIVALVTPFKANKELDLDKFKELIKFHIKNKTDALVICGTTGESSTLSDEEKVILFKEAVKVSKKRIKIIAGTGSNDTHHSIKLSKLAEEAGVDELLVVTPYYNKANEDGLYYHYKSIANSVNIPIVLYNVPSRTGLDISIHNIKRLSLIDNIIGIKEANSNLKKFAKIIRTTKNFKVYTGNDSNIIETLELGSSGVISVFGNLFPNILRDIIDNKDTDLFFKYKKVIDTLFIEVNPIPVKEAMCLIGYDCGSFRLPLYPMSNKNKDILFKTLWEVL